MPRLARMPVLLAYATFVLIGVGAGVTGVVLVAQLSDYGADRATIGITFFTASVGFVLAGVTAGALIERFGTRIALVIGGSGYALAGLIAATHPSFTMYVVLQVAVGYATGVLESVLNAYLTTLPNSTTLLGRLHAFFGVGALLGPPLATWLVDRASWTVVWLVMGIAYVPVVAGFLICYPRQRPEPADGPSEQADEASEPPESSEPAESFEPAAGGLLPVALRQRGVLLGAALLAVYVGLELGVGNWAFSYLTQGREESELLAGYTVSGYWLGLTLGRFLIGPIAARLGATAIGTMSTCLAAVVAIATVTWLVPTAAAASAGFALLGFCLGPIFPTTMAVTPQLTTDRLVPTAIGVMNAGSVLGGSALPWLAGTLGQSAGMWTLLPFAATLGLIQLAVWRPMVHGIRAHRPAPPKWADAAYPVHISSRMRRKRVALFSRSAMFWLDKETGGPACCRNPPFHG